MGASGQKQFRASLPTPSLKYLTDTAHQMLLIVDLQVGLHHLVRDWDGDSYRQNMMAHAELGKLFNLPVVMTTSAEQGFNGPLPKEILDLYPNAPLIKRGGEVKSVPCLVFHSPFLS